MAPILKLCDLILSQPKLLHALSIMVLKFLYVKGSKISPLWKTKMGQWLLSGFLEVKSWASIKRAVRQTMQNKAVPYLCLWPNFECRGWSVFCSRSLKPTEKLSSEMISISLWAWMLGLAEKLEIEKGRPGCFSNRKSSILGSPRCSFLVNALLKPMTLGNTSTLRKPCESRLMAVITATWPKNPCRTIPLWVPVLPRSRGARDVMISAACVGETGITDL